MLNPQLAFHDEAGLKCLKQALACKEVKDLAGAIAALREAYAHIAAGWARYEPEIFLLLPLYLQQVGEREAGWDAMFTLLKDGYPHQKRTPELLPMDESVIYDKMRLFLQRDDLPLHAVLYGFLSHLSRGLGLARQGRTEELRAHLSKVALRQVAAKLFFQAHRSRLVVPATELLVAEAEQIEAFQPAKFAARVKSLLQIG